MTDDEQDEEDESPIIRLNTKSRRSMSSRDQKGSLAPSQVQEVPTVDAILSMTDPMYHGHVRDTRKGVWSRPVGLSKPGVRVLVPANGKFSRLMDYRYYRIPDPEPYDGKYLRSRRVRNISALKSHMSDTKFSGDPPTLVFDFLDRYRDGCIGIDLSEIEAHQYIGDFLDGAAKELYNLITVADRSDTSVVGWCTKVNWLLSKFETDENIQSAVQKRQDMNQEPNESESEYFARFMRQHNFCGNYLESAALRSTFVNSLQPRLRHALHRFISSKREADMADILQFAQDEGKAQRHLKEYLEKGSRTYTNEKDRYRRNNETVRMSRSRGPGSINLLHETAGGSEPIETLLIANQAHDETFDTNSHAYPDSETLSGTSYHTAHSNQPSEKEQLLAMNGNYIGRSVRFAPRPTAIVSKRWDRSEPRPIVLNRNMNSGDICFICYARGHWARDCTLDISSNFLTVVANYGKLSPEVTQKVSKESFIRAVKLLQANVENFSTQAEVAAKSMSRQKQTNANVTSSVVGAYTAPKN